MHLRRSVGKVTFRLVFMIDRVPYWQFGFMNKLIIGGDLGRTGRQSPQKFEVRGKGARRQVRGWIFLFDFLQHAIHSRILTDRHRQTLFYRAKYDSSC